VKSITQFSLSRGLLGVTGMDLILAIVALLQVVVEYGFGGQNRII
jgi:hypothetical protein